MKRLSSASIALFVGLGALALILGALGFQYLDRLPPCEMCMWQRYPHIAASIVGIGGFALIAGGFLPRKTGVALAFLTVGLVLVSGSLGVYHAGVEWQWWQGPRACTGAAFHAASGPLDLNAPVVRCDRAAWRLFGLSLAGYNALLSFGLAGTALALLATRRRNS